MNTTTRQARWISRKGYNALKALSVVGVTDFKTKPEITHDYAAPIGRSVYYQGMSELRAHGIISRSRKIVPCEDGSNRLLKTVRRNLTDTDYSYLTSSIGGIYNKGFSVETMAALTTVVYIDSLAQTIESSGWFSLETYQKHFRIPAQKAKCSRNPRDAGEYVETDYKTMLYRLKKSANTDICSTLLAIDELINSYSTIALLVKNDL